jgi:hypothetical protein
LIETIRGKKKEGKRKRDRRTEWRKGGRERKREEGQGPC